MARRRRRAVLALGALAAAAAHCAALESRHLITFDEAHNVVAGAASEVANEAVSTANTIVSALASTVLGGVTRTSEDDEPMTTSPSTAISVTIGGASTVDEVAEKNTATTTATPSNNAGGGEESFSEEDATPTIADSVTTRAPTTQTPTPTPTVRRSGVAHAVSMTKRPPTRAPTTAPNSGYRPSTQAETGAESTANSGAEVAPTVAPTPTPTTQTPKIAAETQAPVTGYTPTQTTAPVLTSVPVSVATDAPAAPVPVATEIPVTILPTTAPTTAQAPTAADTPMPTTQSSSVSDSGVIDDETDAPATTGSTSTDAVIINPDESTVVPIATTSAPAAETGNTDTAPGTPSTGATASNDGPVSSDSSGVNDTVTISSASGSEENPGEGISPGQVHASSSADVSVDGSNLHGMESSESSRGGKQKKDKKKMESHSSSRDCSAGGSATSSRGGSSTKFSTSSSGNSGDSSGALGALINPGGVSDVNTSSATYYSLGTGSIVAIVGVLAGIMGVLVLFVAIGRKKYSDDDGESPLPYGVDIRSVTRLSPTFMQDDSFMESGYNGTALMVAVPPNQFDGASSTSGESADEVPSLRGNMMAVNHCDPLAKISLRSRVPSVQSFSGDLDAGNVRVSALYSAGSSMTSGSAISGSWSSVLASDTERQPSRNTRDTSLSAWSIANLSSFGSTASGASGLSRMTRSSSAFSADIRRTGGSDRSRSSSRLPTQEETTSRIDAGPVESHRSDTSTEV